MSERIHLAKAAPELYQAVLNLEKLSSKTSAAAGIAEGFTHLLRLRASQINHCAFCIRMHSRDALAKGEPADRLAVLSAWRESAYFTAKERAALALVEAITLVAHDQVPDAIYAEATTHLSSDEIIAVEWLAVTINAWNRIAVSSRYRVEP